MKTYPALVRTVVLMAFQAWAATSALADDVCSFQSPSPVLQPNAYTGQTLTRQSQNRTKEKAQLRSDLRIEIHQSACVDFLTTEFILIVPRDQRRESDQDGWIDFARAEIANLKTRRPAGEFEGLNDFLKRAHGLRQRDGIRSVCRDGSAAAAGECSWESLGGFIFSVTRTPQATRVSVTEYVSG